MSSAKVNGINLYYKELKTSASKEPLLMIMGLTYSSLDWGDKLPKALSKFYRVIIFDNRASGKSEAPTTPFTVSDMADDAAELLSVLKISRAHIFGISMGGMIGQELALNYPNLVQKLVLGCTSCSATFSPASQTAFLESGISEPPAWSLLFTPNFIQSNRARLVQFWKKVEPYHSKGAAYEAQLAAVSQHNVCSRLSKIGVETLILTGDHDPVIDPSNSDYLAKNIPKAVLAKPIKDARHGFSYSHEEETLKLLTDFLK